MTPKQDILEGPTTLAGVLPAVHNNGTSDWLQTSAHLTHKADEGLWVVWHPKVRPRDVVEVGYVTTLSSLQQHTTAA